VPCAPHIGTNHPNHLRMQITLTTWNINSVRFRIDLVAKFIKAVRPDILCLQETKCPDDGFPRKRFKRLGYEHIALNGQRGHHGVVVVSRLPFEATTIRDFCSRSDCRDISIVLGERAGLKNPITLHNLYVPAGGDVPDPAVNPKFAHKLAFLDEMQRCESLRPTTGERAIIVGDLNVAPLPCDVWSHKQLLSVVSHTPIECQKLIGVQKAGGWIDAVRAAVPEPTKLYTWWSYRSPDWTKSNKGRRLDHIWTSSTLADRVSAVAVAKDYRSAKRPSDHVPVTATLEL
jgi:exodeoxyribonuclease-3